MESFATFTDNSVILTILKVSFDYDGVLTTRAGKEMLVKKLAMGDDVFIITARNRSQGASVLEFAKLYKIPVTRVIFTQVGKKWEVIKEKGIELHFDDNQDEMDLIDELTDAETESIDDIEEYND